jgi:anti-anti-sigma regulatory factor
VRYSSIDEIRQFRSPSTSFISITSVWPSICIPHVNGMLRIHRKANGEVVFTLSGQIDQEHIAELETLIAAEGKDRRVILDLKDMTLTGQDGISFLAQCEASDIALVNCDPYVREWITRQRTGT